MKTRRQPTAEQRALAKAKRAQLIQTSAAAKMLVQAGEAETINEALIQIYNNGERHTWKTFSGWKQAGKIVKRGEHAALIWGSKRKSATVDAETEEEKEYSFFPTCSVFNENQVK